LLDSLDRYHNVTPLLSRSVDRKTVSRTRIVADGHQLARIDVNHYVDNPTPEIDRLMHEYVRESRLFGAMILSDYGRGCLGRDDTAFLPRNLISVANYLQIPVFVDPKGGGWKRFEGAFALKPNEKEVLRVFHAGAKEITLPQLELILAANSRNLNIEHMVATLGHQGMYLLSQGAKGKLYPAIKTAMASVTGAGDVGMAAMAAACGIGYPMPEAVEIANVAAGLSVGKYGTSTVDWFELAQAWGELHSYHKIFFRALEDGPYRQVWLEHMTDWAEMARKKGNRIVLTNGCFDLLHAGHERLLEVCKEHGDLLVVAVNSDDMVKIYKGPGRPILDLQTRMRLLAAMTRVDAVTEFRDEEELEVLIRAIKPHVLVKGADCRGKIVPGADFVCQHGGQMIFVPEVGSIHTTKLIEKIRSIGGES